MPKRVGYLYEKVIDIKNCIEAEMCMTDGKDKNNKTVCDIRENTEAYAEKMQKKLIDGTWAPKPGRVFILYDPHRNKYRTITVPCYEDQGVHHAVMQVTIPHIMRRNYRYNCGSIPKAGQTRAVKTIKRWLGGKKPPKYGALGDIYHFYECCPHWLVMAALERMFKDEKFLDLHRKILASMSQTGTGLAIGFYPSQWYANIALMYLIDLAIKNEFHKKKRKAKATRQLLYVRYIDDMGLFSSNKRVLHKAIRFIMNKLGSAGMRLKPNWQVFPIHGRGFPYLSYRFFHGFTILKKSLMYRMVRKAIKTAKHPTPRNAAGVLCHLGILKYCNSYNFKKNWMYPIISISTCKEVVGENARRICRETEGISAYAVA